MTPKVDAGLRIGMSVTLLRDDLEVASELLARSGFDALEVHLSHIGPGLASSPVFEGHAAAAGDLIRGHGLKVSTLNAVGDESFDPFGDPAAVERTIDALALQLRLADAMGSPRLLIWEGIANPDQVDVAPDLLAHCLDRARDMSRLQNPPEYSVECHPFTWAMQYKQLGPLARVLGEVGGGICLDFCHFGLGLGPDFINELDADVLAAVNHIHYSDTDAITPQLHFPPGQGRLDLGTIATRLRGRGLAAGWDLFGWPGPRATVAANFRIYAAFIDAING